MRAMVLDRPGTPLVMRERPLPSPGPGEILIEIEACGVCRTDLHVVDGELPDPKLPIVPGHEIVGRVAAHGPGVSAPAIGSRVGVPWLGWTCGVCPYCRSGRENLCDRPLFTGYTRDGGFASHTVADARYCFALPEEGDAAALAPLMCAGLIGWRSYRMAGQGESAGGADRRDGGQESGHLRIRRRRAHPRPGRRRAGPARLRVHAHRRYGGAKLRPPPRCDVGRRLRGDAAGARSMPRSSSPPSARSCRPPCAR